MMRCERHFSDLSSGVGICASCLRERLLGLIADQLRQAQAQSEAEDRRKSDTHPPPLIFPRSVSPYICRRFDDDSWHHHHNDRRFYSTPQIGLATRKKKHGKFSLISSLFTSSKSDEADADPRVCSDSLATTSFSSNAYSWFSSLLSSRRKKQSRLFTLDEATTAGRPSCRTRDLGMSPAKGINADEDYFENEGSPWASGYLSGSSPAWSKQGISPSVRRRGHSQNNRSLSGLTFCLSPLVRASPNSHRNQNGHLPAMANSGEIGFPGEIRVSNKPHVSTGSFCANRSRKLAFNYNP